MKKAIEDLVQVLTAKAVMSKMDSRIGILNRVEPDGLVFNLEMLGERKFPYHVVKQGFDVFDDFESAIIGIIEREIKMDAVLSDSACYKLACGFYDNFSCFLEGLTNEICYKVIRATFKSNI